MLAAGSAWRILEAEHTQLRELLAAIARILQDAAWKHPGPQLNSLRARIREFQEFEARTHKPKGVALLGAMRGRLAQADELLDLLQDQGQRCEELLVQALERLQALENGADPRGNDVASMLLQHRELMLRQLDQEDTALRAYAAQLLTSEEWSRVVSSISREVQKARRGRAPTNG